MNCKKREYIVFNKRNSTRRKMRFEDTKTNQVQTFKYRENALTEDEKCDTEIRIRLRLVKLLLEI